MGWRAKVHICVRVRARLHKNMRAIELLMRHSSSEHYPEQMHEQT